MKIADIAKLMLLVVLWASAYGLNNIALQTISPMANVFLRLAAGSVFLGTILYIKGEKMPRVRNYKAWLMISGVGIIGSLLPFFLIAQAQTKVPSALASIYLAAMPLAAAILSYFFIRDEKLGLRKIIGVVLGVVGVIILSAPDLANIASQKAPLGAQLQLLGAAFCYGSAVVMIRLGGGGTSPLVTSFGFIFISAIVALPFAFVDIAQNYQRYSSASLIAAIAIGIGPTALAGILYVEAVHRVGPLMVANFSNLVPIVALFIGYIFFAESIPTTALVALAVILLGVTLLQSKAKN
jgi:drug/metabolite transporter (DMT)-like permease